MTQYNRWVMDGNPRLQQSALEVTQAFHERMDSILNQYPHCRNRLPMYYTICLKTTQAYGLDLNLLSPSGTVRLLCVSRLLSHTTKQSIVPLA